MRALIVAAALGLGACATPTDLVGVWRLERYADTPEGGTPVEAFGAHPAGQFVFTREGRAAISIMRNPPGGSAVADPDPDACQPDWYCSYFGAYTLDGGRWTIHVEGGNIPSFIGTDQSRSFEIRGDTLVIAETYEADGKKVRAERVLRRVTR